MTNLDLYDIINAFNIRGKVGGVKVYGSGHINDTYLLKNREPGLPDYLLQKINDHVFKDVEGLMSNIDQVISHLKRKAIATPALDPELNVLTLVKCKNGRLSLVDNNGGHWRMFYFMRETLSYDQVSTENQALQGGLAFGSFLSALADLDPALLIQTIPDFLNIEKRLRDLDIAMHADAVGRLPSVGEEMRFLLERSSKMMNILQLGRAGVLPLRITHNDTKFNNVLLGKDDRFQCVIDLDTVMPGYTAYDFGDAIRTIINQGSEDEKDLSKIRLNIPLFTAFTRGFLAKTLSFLIEQEVQSLIQGVLLLPYMQAVRFLTDHLNGDIYYKINAKGHNLQRTRAQIQLVKMLEEHVGELNGIILREWTNIKNTPSAIKI
ncbi:phosphotransferase enzyme family protein [Mucilaginibacter dorajii]|uniref:Aminoglycoside phosphotransferase family protein n=1 Tax=Mucilaginibacter dorajii TaxID=692994 RepID=A0ABP7QLK2_9SPHI|nr:aminoglycoside phosphotransferase family protein [Mucilaginibacter dorajii]MCS3734062.1 hypothetical protein [Mucilaginibacter dorajii]